MTASRDRLRVFPTIDRLMLLFLALELLAFSLLPLLPLVVAASALLTPLRHSRSRMTVLWILGGILAVIVLAPFVLTLIGSGTVEEGPVHTV